MPQPLGPMMPTLSPRMIVVEKAPTIFLSSQEKEIASASTTIRPLRSASRMTSRETPACSCLRARSSAHLHQCPDPALVAGAARPDPLPDPRLFLGQLLVEVVPLLLFSLQQGLPALQIGPVITGKGDEAPPVDFHDACRQAAEKCPVMGHEHECLFVLEQEVLKPEDGSDIQMVGGLVEEQHVGFAHQGPRQKDPAFHARGQKPELGVPVEIGPRDHRFHPLVIPARRPMSLSGAGPVRGCRADPRSALSRPI